ncbi:alginate lyase family protein [Candidatus Fermentibacteria bacterium]|nr:alginate lyase family protein [Candidatus Fermentibacteria bacterium]
MWPPWPTIPDCPPFFPHRSAEARAVYRALGSHWLPSNCRGSCATAPFTAAETCSGFYPCPTEVPGVMETAEEALAGRFRLWAHRLELGTPSWHVDPLSGYTWPHDRHIVIFPPQGPPGGLRRVWELNRMAWLYDLALASHASGQGEFSAAGWRHVIDWVTSNPPGLGVNWTSPLEMAMRVLAWLAFMDISGTIPPPEFRDQFWESVAAQTRHAAWHLSLRPAPNNHLAGEALLLLAVGRLCPWIAGATAWARLGRDLLVWAVDSCVLPDGGPAEGSLGYLMFVLEIYWLADRILTHTGGLPFPAHVQNRLTAGCAVVNQMANRAWAPCLGDSDEATMFPWLPSLAHRAGWLQEGAGSWGSPATRVDISDTRSASPHDSVCDAWASASRGDFTVVYAAGRLGLPPLYGHGHAHALSILLWLRERPVLIDPGTYSYAEQPWRDYFRSTAAHSTVEVEGVSQAVPLGDFQWCEPYACRSRLIPHPEACVMRGTHDGYLRLPQRVRHDRRIKLWRGGLEVEDTAHGRSRFVARLHWHVHPEWIVCAMDGKSALLSCGSDRLCIRIEGPGRLTAHSGSLEPLLGWFSPGFEQRLPTTTLRVEAADSAIRWRTTIRRP